MPLDPPPASSDPGPCPGRSRRCSPPCRSWWWIERTRWDRRSHRAQFVIEPRLPGPLRRRVDCHGDYELLALAEDRTLRRITVVLRIAAPGVGRTAEAILARVITEQFAGEAALLAALTRSPG